MRESFAKLFHQLFQPVFQRIKPASAPLAWGIAASALAAVAVVLAMAVLGEYTKTLGRLLLTAIIMGGFFLTTLAPAALAGRRPGSALAQAGLAAALAGVTLLLVGVWATPNSDGFWKAAAILAVLALALSYVSVSALRQVPGGLAASIANRLSLVALLSASIVSGVGIAWGVRSATFWWVVTLLVLLWAVFGLVALAKSWLRARLQRRGSRTLGRD